MQDTDYMKMAIELAKKGSGHVNPNPLVGAVIVKDGKVIGEGWHERFGGLHAERNALANCKSSPQGATIYVTLEPCCHWGKTPPCTDAIIESGISRVVVGSTDPNPKVAGEGLNILRGKGIKVKVGVLKEECDRLNDIFFHYILKKTPFVTLKYAMTMDGKIATHTGESRWITNETSRAHVHALRNRYAGIMAGIGTVLADDPLLTSRIPGGRNPLRIICDSHLRTPPDSQIAKTAKDVPTIIAFCDAPKERMAPLEAAGCELLCLPAKNSHIDLAALMRVLGEREIDSVLLEGGGELNWSALKSGIVHKVMTYIAPKIFGGENSPSPVRGMGVELPEMGIILSKPFISWFEEDILLESEVLSCSQEL
ncbi:MAG: bifunctional diaminohydroxyphosphoribosylaminopyrimidine deaminase/5-amino-6-(5-phosphoribosylamino)uracil reductase RibD [Firmicutes bacterium]|nr:bifunctional diaminohydroxyphosphoribosylaminopyrimidine deaminase/5-amino-6-(5-phosphoribosylamino)uracil reductase RibD [Bacillota bacterium]